MEHEKNELDTSKFLVFDLQWKLQEKKEAFSKAAFHVFIIIMNIFTMFS